MRGSSSAATALADGIPAPPGPGARPTRSSPASTAAGSPEMMLRLTDDHGQIAGEFMYPTVSEVLTLPVIRGVGLRLVAGMAGLGRRVRWVHVAEVADIARLLRGGELVLTTGIALPGESTALTRYIDEVADAGAAGLVVEMVRRWNDTLPAAMLVAADKRELPLVTLSKETRFVEVTEAVISLIRDDQLAELRAAEQVHEAFTVLTVSGAGPAEVLREVVRAAGLPVVLETLSRDVLAYNAAGVDPAKLLARWRERSIAVTPTQRTGYDPCSGWLVTVVGSRGYDWARLVLVCPEPPQHRHVVTAEGAASALAVHRLLACNGDTLERQTHQTLLTELLTARMPSADLTIRTAALGVPLEDRVLVGIAVWPRTAEPRAELPPALAAQELLCNLAEATALAAKSCAAPTLVGVVDDTCVRALISLDRHTEVEPMVGRLAGEIHQRAVSIHLGVPVIVAVGSTVGSIPSARRTLSEAKHIAQVALRAGPSRNYYRLTDVRLRGLLQLLQDDDRLAAFSERELGPLLAYDARSGGGLMQVLRELCQYGGNISAAAGAAHRSRTSYYKQVSRIEQILGVSLTDPESRLSLYVALLAMDADGGR